MDGPQNASALVEFHSDVAGKTGVGRAYGPASGYLYFHLYAGGTDKLADWFEKVIEQRYPQAAAMLHGPAGATLRTSPRWEKLARMMNLPGAP